MRKIGSLGFTFVLLFILAISSFASAETKTPVTNQQSKPATAQDGKVSEKMKVNSPVTSKTVNAKQPAPDQTPSSPTTKNWFSYVKKFWATIVSVVLVVMMIFMYGKDIWAPKSS